MVAGQQKTSLLTIDRIVNELMNQVTIQKGEKADTAAIRNLFHHTAQLHVLINGDTSMVESVTLDDFLVLMRDPYYEEGYLEQEIHKVVDEFNGIANVFQSFYGKDSEGAEERGINSYQLVYYDERWWILNMVWTMETEDKKLPTRYLEK